MFYLPVNMEIYGGFFGNEVLFSQRSWQNHPTELDGDLGVQNSSADNAFHVLFIDGTTSKGAINSTTIVDGFIIRNGNANNPNFQLAVAYGGGIYNAGSGAGSNCSPTIRNCRILDNYGSFGGGVYNDGSADGQCDPIFTNCSFIDNAAQFGGGAMNSGINGGQCDATFINCLFSQNQASNQGGGLYNNGFQGSTQLYFGNCSFSQNSATNEGGTMRNQGDSGIGLVTIENAIIWSNGNEFSNQSATVSLDYSILNDGTDDGVVSLPPGVSGANNLDHDPLFVDAANNDLKLQVNSPAIDMGSSAASGLSGITQDIAGEQRVINGTVDMGAFESQCPAALNFGNTIYVKKDATGAADGSSWENAYTDLQDALDFSCNCVAEGVLLPIWVAADTFVPSRDRYGNTNPVDPYAKTFYISGEVEVYGGFTGTESNLNERDWLTNKTIISGDFPEDGVGGAFAITGLTIDGTSDKGGITNTCLIDGLTFLRAQNLLRNEGSGAGAVCSPSIENCHFLYATQGIVNEGNYSGISSPLIKNCVFDSMWFFNIYNVGVGGNSSPVIDQCLFLGGLHPGTSMNFGSVIQNNGTVGGIANPVISNCTFRDIKVAGELIANGGSGGESSPTIVNCSFTDNVSDGFGVIGNNGRDGVSSPVITNCSFSNNEGWFAGAISNDAIRGESKPVITNCSFVNNSGDPGSYGNAGAIYNRASNNNPAENGVLMLTLNNVIFWGNTSTAAASGDNISQTDIALTEMNNSIFEDDSADGNVVLPAGVSGTGNIDFNPQFVDAANNDLQLTQYSPAIDLGDKTVAQLSGVDTDLAGNMRVFGIQVDAGAYEFQDYVCDDINLSLGSNSQTTGTYSGRSTLVSSATIEPGENVLYTAGQSITLSPGFHAKEGADFHAIIASCAQAQTFSYPPEDYTAPEDIPESPTVLVKELSLSLSPNPVKSRAAITLYLPEAGVASLELYSVGGVLLESVQGWANFTQGYHSFELKAQKYSPGLYFLVVRHKGGVLNKRLVISD